jgi:hypothetical protein
MRRSLFKGQFPVMRIFKLRKMTVKFEFDYFNDIFGCDLSNILDTRRSQGNIRLQPQKNSTWSRSSKCLGIHISIISGIARNLHQINYVGQNYPLGKWQIDTRKIERSPQYFRLYAIRTGESNKIYQAETFRTPSQQNIHRRIEKETKMLDTQ